MREKRSSFPGECRYTDQVFLFPVSGDPHGPSGVCRKGAVRPEHYALTTGAEVFLRPKLPERRPFALPASSGCLRGAGSRSMLYQGVGA